MLLRRTNSYQYNKDTYTYTCKYKSEIYLNDKDDLEYVEINVKLAEGDKFSDIVSDQNINKDFLYSNFDEIKEIRCNGDKCGLSLDDVRNTHCIRCNGELTIDILFYYLLKEYINIDKIDKKYIIDKQIIKCDVNREIIEKLLDKEKIHIRQSNDKIKLVKKIIEEELKINKINDKIDKYNKILNK